MVFTYQQVPLSYSYSLCIILAYHSYLKCLIIFLSFCSFPTTTIFGENVLGHCLSITQILYTGSTVKCSAFMVPSQKSWIFENSTFKSTMNGSRNQPVDCVYMSRCIHVSQLELLAPPWINGNDLNYITYKSNADL